MVARVRPSQALSDLLVDALKRVRIRVDFRAFIAAGRRFQPSEGNYTTPSETRLKNGIKSCFFDLYMSTVRRGQRERKITEQE